MGGFFPEISGGEVTFAGAEKGKRLEIFPGSSIFLLYAKSIFCPAVAGGMFFHAEISFNKRSFRL